MANIGMSISLDTSGLQQGAKAASDSLGEMYDKMAKLQTAGEKKNAIYDYMNNANAAIQQLVESINGMNNLQTVSNNQTGGIENKNSRTAFEFTNQSSRATEILKNANIDRLKSQVEIVNEKLGEMYEKIKDIDAASNPQGFSSMADSIARLEDVKRGLNGDIAKLENGNKKDSGNSVLGLAKQFMGGGPVGFLGKLGIAGAITAAIVKGVDWGFKTVSGKRQADIAAEGQYLNGDVIGASIAERENSWWTHIPLIGGIIKSGIQVFDTNKDRKTMTELNAWLKESAPSIDTLSLFGNLNQTDAAGNSRNLLENYSNAANLVSAGGTGYAVNDLIESENEYAKYGLSQKNAESNADSILKWQRATGAARNELIDFTGYTMRYGASGSATEALGVAYGGLQSSRMEKGQLSEFLRGMQSIMEEGISKGFVIGAEEVSRNMAFLSKLTGGNAMWSGENAASKISGINSSLEQSTSLDSVASVLNLQVAMRNIGSTQSEFDDYVGRFKAGNKDISLYTGTFLDPLMAMEKGLKPETVATSMEALQKMYNIGFGADGTLTGDVGSAATMLSQMWGLNNTGAVQVLKTWAINGQFTNDDIEKITSDPAMLTKETNVQKAIEDIRANVQKIAEKSLDKSEPLLEKLKVTTDYSAPRSTEIVYDYDNEIIVDRAKTAQRAQELGLKKSGGFFGLGARDDEAGAFLYDTYSQTLSQALEDYNSQNPEKTKTMADFINMVSVKENWNSHFYEATLPRVSFDPWGNSSTYEEENVITSEERKSLEKLLVDILSSLGASTRKLQETLSQDRNDSVVVNVVSP